VSSAVLEPPKDHIPLIAPSIELTANGQRVKLSALETGSEFTVRFEPVQEPDRRLASALAYLIRLADSQPGEEITSHE
jgi:hypothetical protein